jgi:hypothetical protein
MNLTLKAFVLTMSVFAGICIVGAKERRIELPKETPSFPGGK